MTEETLLLKALKHISSICNFATSHDAKGFNKFDASTGHELAALDHLTPRQMYLARKMLKKYHKQLNAVGINLEKSDMSTEPLGSLESDYEIKSRSSSDDPEWNDLESDPRAPFYEGDTSTSDVENTGIILSEDQQKALDFIVGWWKENREHKSDNSVPITITLGGFAGTGKTTIMSELRKAIDAKNVNFMAFTGKATLNMRKKLYNSEVMKSGDECTTIHKFLYSPIVDEKTGEIKEWRKLPKRTPDLIIIDEASMVNRDIWNDLASLNVPILAVGDHGQLPPVQKGDVFNLMENPMIKLEKIHRQAEESPIIRMSMMAREMKFIPFQKNTNEFGTACKVNSFSEYVDLLEQSMFNEGELYVLTDLNRRRVRLNQSILERFNLRPKDGYPSPGSRLICLKNNMKRNPPIFNGMHCTLKRIGRMDNWGNFSAEVSDDEGYSFWIDKMSTMFFMNETGKMPEGVNWKTVGEQFDYGYAMTVHKAQGSEADRVFIFGTGFGEVSDRARWLYTAITRAKKEVYLCGDKI